MADYVELALVKDALKITDSDRDDLLNGAIAAASQSIDRLTGRRFDLDESASARRFAPSRTTVLSREGERLLVPDIGSDDGLVVEVGRDPDWTDITDDVEFEPLNALDESEPYTSVLHEDSRFSRWRRVRVTARWGWPVVPDVVEQAALIQAQRLFKRKDSPEGVLGSAEWGTVRVSRIDPDVAALIQDLMLPGIA